jgi:tetratricopeptide (TPR) repeat protein
MAGREGLAAIFAKQARHELDIGLKNQSTLSMESLDEADSHLSTALSIDQNNPFFLEDRGRLLDTRAMLVKWLPPEQRKQAWESSRKSFRKALVVRPISPYTWANLALINSRLGEWNEETQLALRQAAILGPWEPEVQAIIADVGWAGWDKWPAELKPILEDNIVRGSIRQRETMLRLISGHQRKNNICMNRKLYDALKPGWCG